MRIEAKKYALYKHSIDGAVLYVGLGSDYRAFECRRRNPKWNELVAKSGHFDVHIVKWFKTRKEGLLEEALLIRELKPIANMMMNGFSRTPKFKNDVSAKHKGKYVSEETRLRMQKASLSRTLLPVKDNQTGVIYKSCKEAALALNIPVTTLRGHLKGQLDHAGGGTFAYALRGEELRVAEKR